MNLTPNVRENKVTKMNYWGNPDDLQCYREVPELILNVAGF